MDADPSASAFYVQSIQQSIDGMIQLIQWTPEGSSQLWRYR